MRALLAALGDPQRALPGDPRRRHERQDLDDADDRRAAALPPACDVGAYISPHVRGWSERIQVDGADADLEAALARVRPHAAGATQFEVLTAAALAEFAAREGRRRGRRGGPRRAPRRDERARRARSSC